MADNSLSNISDKIQKLLSKPISVTLIPEEPEELSEKIQDLEEKARFLKRNKEKGFVNEKNGSSLSLKEDGQITLAPSKYGQRKIHPSGRITTLALENEITTNRCSIQTDEIIINNHKLNPALYELTDCKFTNLPSTSNAIIGNFVLEDSILVKAWEPNLKRYMMIRRPARIPLFGKELNVPEMHSALRLTDPTQLKENILAFSEKGYQVNAKITDKNSLIGKEGINRGSEYGGYVETNYDSSGGANMGVNTGSEFIMTAADDPSLYPKSIDDPTQVDQIIYNIRQALAAKGFVEGAINILIAVMKYESGRFKFIAAPHNYGGISTTRNTGYPRPANEGGYYVAFNTDAEYVENWCADFWLAYDEDMRHLTDPGTFVDIMYKNEYFIPQNEEQYYAYRNSIIDITYSQQPTA